MTKDEMIEIIERGMPSLGTGEDPTMQRSVAHRGAIRVYDALLAAGVIPAEGTVTIDRGRWERVSTVAVRAKTADRAERAASLTMDVAVRARLSIEAYGKRIEMGEACDDLLDGDLDAIPAAPTGEETP